MSGAQQCPLHAGLEHWAKDSREGLARDAAAVPAEIKGATFGVFVTKNLLTQLAQAQFAELPKSPTGYPNIHLTDLSGLGFTPGSPPAIETYINGYDVVGFPTPDVHFTTTVTDKLTARVDSGTPCTPWTDPNCGCQTSSKTDSDDITAEIIAAIANLSGMPPNFPGLGTLLAIYVDVNDLNALHTPKGSQAGAGCTLYQGLPSEIALPQTGGPPPDWRRRKSCAAGNPQHRCDLAAIEAGKVGDPIPRRSTGL